MVVEFLRAVRLAAVKDLFDRTGHKMPVQIEVMTDAMVEAEIARREAELDL